MEQEHRFSCVLRDCSDASTNFLDLLYGGSVPGAGGFNCHWQKDVRGRQRAILYNLVRCCLVCIIIIVINQTDQQTNRGKTQPRWRR